MSRESGFRPDLQETLRTALADDELLTRTDALASPTGFPFKVALVDGTLSDPELRTHREPLCDLGHLRTAYRREDGRVDYRCPAEPVAMFERKGGDAEEIPGRVCLCNALVASVGLAQTRKDGSVDLPLVTLGDDLEGARVLLEKRPLGYSAADAIAWLRGEAVEA
jgi:hypothetical protein